MAWHVKSDDKYMIRCIVPKKYWILYYPDGRIQIERSLDDCISRMNIDAAPRVLRRVA